MTTPTKVSLEERVDALPWGELIEQLDGRGFAITPEVLSVGECDELAALFDGGQFRATVEMARHRFGDGRYRYFAHPLPDPVAQLRSSFYRHLAPVANAWSERLRGEEESYPQVLTVLSRPGVDFEGGEFVLVEQRPRAQRHLP